MIQIPAAELEFSFVRSSGPGGQNVNKVNSKVQLHWNVMMSPSIPDDVRARFVAQFGSRINSGGYVVVSSEQHRDQPRNKQDCVDKLHGMLASVWKAPRKRKKSKPTRSSQLRRRESKKRHSEKKANRSHKY